MFLKVYILFWHVGITLEHATHGVFQVTLMKIVLLITDSVEVPFAVRQQHEGKNWIGMSSCYIVLIARCDSHLVSYEGLRRKWFVRFLPVLLDLLFSKSTFESKAFKKISVFCINIKQCSQLIETLWQ